MNPFLYKAHPLLVHWADLVLNPTASGLEDFSALLVAIMAANGVFAFGLVRGVRLTGGISLPFWRGYVLALPSCLLYTPPTLTVLADIAAGAFHWEDRFILVFAIFVASQVLGAFYTVAVRYRGGNRPIGVAAGMTVSLWMLLISIPVCLVLLVLDAFGAFRT